mgnify:CR=1 FL=1
MVMAMKEKPGFFRGSRPIYSGKMQETIDRSDENHHFRVDSNVNRRTLNPAGEWYD